MEQEPKFNCYNAQSYEHGQLFHFSNEDRCYRVVWNCKMNVFSVLDMYGMDVDKDIEKELVRLVKLKVHREPERLADGN